MERIESAWLGVARGWRKESQCEKQHRGQTLDHGARSTRSLGLAPAIGSTLFWSQRRSVAAGSKPIGAMLPAGSAPIGAASGATTPAAAALGMGVPWSSALAAERNERAVSATPSMVGGSNYGAGAGAGGGAALRIRLRPHAPLPARPLLLACSYETTLGALKTRIARTLRAPGMAAAEDIRIEVDGFTIAEEDGVVGDLVRETDIVE